MKLPLTGACRCGQLAWRCEAAPNFTVNCSCRACQLTSGAPYVSALNVDADAVTITGAVRHVVRSGDSGKDVEDGFCADCGARVFSWAASLPRTMGIMATTLDERDGFSPMFNIYASQAPPWHTIDRSIPTFDTVPSAPHRRL